MKTAIYTAIFALLSITISYSQTSLVGKVTDSATDEPILFGTVSLYKKDILITAVETDLDGIYSFSDIDPGTYDVEASYTGYSTIIVIDIIVKAGRTNRVDIAINPGGLVAIDDLVENKEPLKEMDDSDHKATVTSEAIRSLPTLDISGHGMATSISGVTSEPSMRGKRKDAASYYADGAMTTSGSVSSIAFNRSELPISGQMTAGEWNDLHNWKDWLTLLEDESYSIMMERFAIHPTERYSVMVINKQNAVLPKILVQLIDKNENVLWESYTDNSGKAELWVNAFDKGQSAFAIRVANQVKSDIVKIENGSNTFVLGEDCYSPDKMDIVFTVDATSSMNDEINYLKSELLDVIDRIKETNKNIDFNLGSVFYRDVNDEYLTRVSPLSANIEETINFVGNQNSNGGGDRPEAVEAALEETLNLSWRERALKLVFLILDAPPREDDATMDKIRSQIKEAASRGIKLIPVTASGIGRETEFLMKFMSILTNGTYVFITDDSGIGDPHLDPVVEDYQVEKLNDCLVRLITQYSKSYSCDANIKSEEEEIEVKIYPNPATQFISVTANSIPDKIKIYSANGMMVKTITPNEKETRIELGDFVNGIYTISIIIGDKVESKQIILLK